MIKALMVPIRPEHALHILNGKKTLDLRTWIPKDYVGWVYVYVTKSYPLLNYIDGKYELMDRKKHIIFHNIGMYEFYNHDIHLNGKVVARFWFDEYETLEPTTIDGIFQHYITYKYRNELCLSQEDIDNYGKGKDLYAWHIKKLEIFDEPKQLSDFYVTNKGLTYKYIKEYEERTHDYVSFRLKKAPQRSLWAYTRELENEQLHSKDK